MTGRHARPVYVVDVRPPLRRTFSIRHTFPNGQTIGDGYIHAGNTNPPPVAVYDEAYANGLADHMREVNPGHTFEVVQNCPLHGPGCEAWA